MIYIWFGLDGSGIQHSVSHSYTSFVQIDLRLTLAKTEFHEILGPALMIAFAFLGNTLFLTILVSMLSSTFSTIVSTSTAEIQFRHAVLTLEGVKADAIFAYQPPFNILAIVFFTPLKFFISPRWFHKIHVFSVRLLNLPILLIIAVAERRALWPGSSPFNKPGSGLAPTLSIDQPKPNSSKPRWWIWDRLRHGAHGYITTVFDLPPPDSVVDEIATDDSLTKNLIRRQYTQSNTAERDERPDLGGLNGARDGGSVGAPPTPTPSGVGLHIQLPAPQKPKNGEGTSKRKLNRRDSIAPFPGLRAELQGVLSESDEMTDITARLEALERTTRRIESMLERLVACMGEENESVEANPAADRTGTLKDLDCTRVDESD